MAKTSNCLQLIDRMPQQDQDAILARLDALQAKGLTAKEAQLQAAIDVLAQVEREGQARKSPPRLSEDIPNDEWLQGKIDYAMSKGRNQWGVPHMSTVTGYFDKPVEVSLRVLSRLKGERDEQNNVREDSLEYIRKNWDEVSQQPPYIEVAYNGEAWVSEGNHRIMVAAENGLESMPVEIRYFDGGQRRSGPLNPSRIPSLEDGSIRMSADREANFERWTRGLPVIEADFSGTYDGGPAVFQAYHGTTHTDIQEFKSIGSKEGALGQGPYFSTSVDDVNENYAGVGPDLTSRIGREIDNVAQGFDDDAWYATDVLQAYFDNNGIDTEITDDNIEELKDEHRDKAIEHAATRALKGDSDGFVMPVYVRLEKPFNMATSPTYFEMTYPVDENGEPDYEAEPEGSAVDLINAINEVASGYNADADGLTSWVYENGTDGVSAREVWDRAGKDISDLYDDNGEMISSGQFMQEVARELGFDGLIQDADAYFGTQRRGFGGIRAGAMKGVQPGTLHIMPFDGAQVKSATGNGGEFGENREILKSVDRPQFYSQLQRTIEGVPDRLASMAAPQWKLWLDSNGPKQGVKKDEIEWSGIKDYLDLQGKKKLSKDELSSYLDDSGVKVSETMRGEVDQDETYEQMARDMFDAEHYDLSPRQTRELQQAHDRMLTQSNTAYEKYTLPGGKNYRELLITLPGGVSGKELAALDERIQELEDDRDGAEYDERDEIDERISAVQVERNALLGNGYRSSHWDEPNVLAHIRVNDREIQEIGYVARNFRSGFISQVFATPEEAIAYQANLPESVKTEIVEHPRFVRVLFVEEVQSDWGQDGLKKGFKPSDAQIKANGEKSLELRKRIMELRKQGFKTPDDGTPESEIDPKFLELRALLDQEEELRKKGDFYRGLPPSAPFVTKTEGWLNLALKRIAMMAVEGGYDKVAFVNGEQSADRYDLSKQISSISYEPGSKTGNEGLLQAWDLNRKMVMSEMVTTDRIEDYVGKEVAVRLLEADKVRGKHLLDGENVKVGGKGMIKFYDEIVPQALNKLLPKLGGEKLGAVDIGSMDTKQGREGDALLAQLGVEVEGKRPPTQPGFDVTDKMRETVKQGLPLFSRDRKQTATPEFKKWFGDSKVVDAEGSPLVVYHGSTAKGITEFDTSRVTTRNAKGDTPGTYFTADQMAAGNYTRELGAKAGSPRGEIVAAYLRIENPLNTTATIKKFRKQGMPFGDAKRKALEALTPEHDGIIFDGDGANPSEYVVFNPEQIKSAAGNNGDFDSTNPDIRKSTARKPWFEDLSKLKVSTNYQLGDLLKTSRKLSWWDRTVGTQYNLAQKQPEFKRVFDAVQMFINDVSAYATRAADLAPTILPKLDGLKDIIKKPMSAEDVAALRDPVFGGTLKYARDENGEIYEEDDVQKAGVVFSDEELKSMFKLSDAQIGLYRQFRKSVDQSVTDLALSDMIRYLGEDGRDIAETVMASGNVDVAVGVIESHLADLAKSTPPRAETLAATTEAIQQKGEQANRLMDRGYAPLSRFGQFTTYVVGKDGEQLYFGMFENERDAQKMAREMREQYPDATVSTSTMSQESYKLFSGVTPETLALFGESLGLEESGIDTKSEVFQQYLKVAKTNRSAMKRLIQRKGVNGFSEDAGRVLAGFVYSNARQISTNLHAGEIGKAAADVKDGDVKDAAIRLMEYIQNPQEEAQAIRGLMFTQFIGGSIASALVNMTQPFTMTAPYLAQFDGVTGATKRMADAMKLVTKGVRNDADLKDALKRAEELGIVSPQEVHQLMAQARGKGSLITGDGTKVGDAAAKANNFTAKLGLAWGKAFSAAEQFNRRITFIAAYKLARDKGMENPFAFAEQTIAETQGVYNKGNKPAWARGAIGGTLFTFKQYSISYIEFLQRMWGNGPEGKKAVGLALGVLFMSAGLGGLPGADDLDDVIDGFAQRVLGKSFDSKQAKKEFFASILGQAGAEFVMGGLTGLPGAPIDLSGRLGLGNLIPGTGIFTKKSDYGRDIAEIFGPAGSLFKQAAVGAGKLVQGDVTGAVKEVAPVAGQNVIKAVDMAIMGMYRDTKGRKVIDVEPWEAAAKAIGFQPASVKRVQDATGTQQNLIGQNKLRETEIADKWAAGRIERNASKVEEAKAELAEWNRKNPQSPISIDAGQINRRVQQAMMDKAKRLEKTAPKEIRESVKRELERASN